MASDNDVTPEGPHFVRICGFKVFSDFTSTHAWYHCCEGFLLFFMFFSLADGKHVQRQRNLLLRRLLYLRCLSALPPQPNGDWRIFFLSSTCTCHWLIVDIVVSNNILPPIHCIHSKNCVVYFYGSSHILTYGCEQNTHGKNNTLAKDVLQIKHDHINIWIISWILANLERSIHLIKHTISDGLETNQFLSTSSVKNLIYETGSKAAQVLKISYDSSLQNMLRGSTRGGWNFGQVNEWWQERKYSFTWHRLKAIDKQNYGTVWEILFVFPRNWKEIQN